MLRRTVLAAAAAAMLTAASPALLAAPSREVVPYEVSGLKSSAKEIHEAILKAVKAVDACVKTVVQAAQAAGYEMVIIADHGNADNAVNADGSPNTAHSLNPVPIVVVSDRVQSVENGVLADVAPTVLALMGVKAPEAMSGHSLVTLKA